MWYSVHICKSDRSKTWGKERWKKVVVCFGGVSEGKDRKSFIVLLYKLRGHVMTTIIRWDPDLFGLIALIRHFPNFRQL